MTSGPSSATTTASSRPRTEDPSVLASPRWLRAGVSLALTGATLGTSLDAIHVHTATTAYTHPALAGQAAWVPPLFASAGVLMGLGRPLAERLVGRVTPAPSWGTVGVAMAAFMLAYGLSGLLHPWPSACTVVLGALFVAAWLRCDRTGLGLVLAALTAIIGTAVETLLVAVGGFRYLEPSLGLVAVWLPALYCCAAVGVGTLGKRLVDG
jgi:hypothetical protein